MMCRYSSPIGLLQGSFKDSFGVFSEESVLFFYYLFVYHYLEAARSCVGWVAAVGRLWLFYT